MDYFGKLNLDYFLFGVDGDENAFGFGFNVNIFEFFLDLFSLFLHAVEIFEFAHRV